MVDFQQQITQRLVDEYDYMNSQNDRLDLRLNPLQRENYFIDYGKSYVIINCNYACFHSLQLFLPITVCSSINIQYQSTGVGSLSLLGKIELRRSIRGGISCRTDFK